MLLITIQIAEWKVLQCVSSPTYCVVWIHCNLTQSLILALAELLLRYASGQTDKHTKRQTDMLIAMLRSPTGDRVKHLVSWTKLTERKSAWTVWLTAESDWDCWWSVTDWTLCGAASDTLSTQFNPVQGYWLVPLDGLRRYSLLLHVLLELLLGHSSSVFAQ